MQLTLYISLVCLYLSDLVKCVNVEEGSKSKKTDSEVGEVFQATHEWQPLPKGMAIPRGLHVRLNLQTGQREAKLMDPEDEDKDNYDITSLNMQGDADIPPITSTLGREELKHILHNIDKNEPLVPEEGFSQSKPKYRTYEELKKELYNMNAEVKTDMEIMAELVKNYKDLAVKRSKPDYYEASEQEELNILTDLEFLVHQIDNAKEFVKTGITDIVFPSLNSTYKAIRYEATKLLGSAVQSNPSAQITALERGTVNVLLRTITLDTVSQVRSGAIFAISCLLRKFPAAQATFIERGGVNVITNLFNTDSSQHSKLQSKVLVLLNDLITEKREAERDVLDLTPQTNPKVAEHMKEKLRQYNTVRLERKLVEEGWCALTSKLLLRHSVALDENFEELVNDETSLDHESIDNVLSIMLSMSHFCRDSYQTNEKLLQSLRNLDSFYYSFARQEFESDPKYFTGLYNLVSSLMDDLSTNNTIVKDEL